MQGAEKQRIGFPYWQQFHYLMGPVRQVGRLLTQFFINSALLWGKNRDHLAPCTVFNEVRRGNVNRWENRVFNLKRCLNSPALLTQQASCSVAVKPQPIPDTELQKKVTGPSALTPPQELSLAFEITSFCRHRHYTRVTVFVQGGRDILVRATTVHEQIPLHSGRWFQKEATFPAKTASVSPP